MITDFWAAGILFSIAVFAAKAGLAAGSINIKTRWIIGLALLYGVVSILTGVILKIINPPDYFEFFQKFTSQGVIAHLLFSVGLMAWGMYIMQRFSEKEDDQSGEFFLLMFPCPVSIAAMLSGCSIFSALTDIEPVKAGAVIAGVLMILIPAVALSVNRFAGQGRKNGNGRLMLGFILTMTGFYFAVSVIVIPVYSKAKTLLAAGTMVRGDDVSPVKMTVLVAVGLIIVLCGFIGNHRKNDD